MVFFFGKAPSLLALKKQTSSLATKSKEKTIEQCRTMTKQHKTTLGTICTSAGFLQRVGPKLACSINRRNRV